VAKRRRKANGIVGACGIVDLFHIAHVYALDSNRNIPEEIYLFIYLLYKLLILS
jgi:glycerol-3-phosphate cytidylyltransferase-like family protein